MKLLLKHTVPNLGEAGEIVDISDGYGRNYLLPQRLAVPNTLENRRWVEEQKLVLIQREADREKLAKHAAKDLKRELLQVHMKAQDDGTLYGSVTTAVIADVVEKAKGYRLEERWIVLAQPIKRIGDYDITVKLPGDSETTFKLTVLPESEA